MSRRLDGKVAIVIGGASGIGRATALRLATEGARVVVVDRSADGGEETVGLIREAGGTASFEQVDVRDEAAVEGMVAAALDRYGGLDCAHNNAGIGSRPIYTAEITAAQWERMIATNLTSVFLCMKYEIPAMLARGGGSIVNTSSGAGLTGVATLAHYSAAKHGVIGLTRSASAEYARDGIRVNAVCPGVTDTPMVQGSAFDRSDKAEPSQIAEVVAWLCSTDASWVSGQAIEVNGGRGNG